jgi:hypothetical protein
VTKSREHIPEVLFFGKFADLYRKLALDLR